MGITIPKSFIIGSISQSAKATDKKGNASLWGYATPHSKAFPPHPAFQQLQLLTNHQTRKKLARTGGEGDLRSTVPSATIRTSCCG